MRRTSPPARFRRNPHPPQRPPSVSRVSRAKPLRPGARYHLEKKTRPWAEITRGNGVRCARRRRRRRRRSGEQRTRNERATEAARSRLRWTTSDFRLADLDERLMKMAATMKHFRARSRASGRDVPLGRRLPTFTHATDVYPCNRIYVQGGQGPCCHLITSVRKSVHVDLCAQAVTGGSPSS